MSLISFVILAFLALITALGVILSKNAVYSALSLLAHFLVIALFYFALSAQFLGIVQVIVYAGAIVVLFLFVTMLIGGNITDTIQKNRPATRLGATVLGALFLLGLIVAFFQKLPMGAAPAGAPDAGSVQAIAGPLYTTYLLPFELASILLLAGMLGGVALALRDRKR